MQIKVKAAMVSLLMLSFYMLTFTNKKASAEEMSTYNRVVNIWATSWCLEKKGYMKESKALEWAVVRLIEFNIYENTMKELMGRKNFLDDAAKAVRLAGGCEKMVNLYYEPTKYRKIVGIYAEIYCLYLENRMTEKNALKWGKSKLRKDYGISDASIGLASKIEGFGEDVSDAIRYGGGCKKIVNEFIDIK